MPHEHVLGLAGGLILGAAALLLLLLNGKLAGISGILGGALAFADDVAWRWSFLAGLVLAGLAAYWVAPEAFAVTVPRSTGAYVVAGMLVGVGTAVSGGCTSGHGICGIGRLSTRSIVATVVFMVTGALTVYVVQHLLGGGV